MTNKEKNNLNDDQLNKIAGGKLYPQEPEEFKPDEAVLENLQDNKGADE